MDETVNLLGRVHSPLPWQLGWGAWRVRKNTILRCCIGRDIPLCVTSMTTRTIIMCSTSTCIFSLWVRDPNVWVDPVKLTLKFSIIHRPGFIGQEPPIGLTHILAGDQALIHLRFSSRCENHWKSRKNGVLQKALSHRLWQNTPGESRKTNAVKIHGCCAKWECK